MTVYLLDINLLLALTDPVHVHHGPAHAWFAATGEGAWATCPLTENGFIRIASHPSYPNRPGNVPAVLAILRQMCALQGHQFWAEDISVRDLLTADQIVSHTQITDVYLLGLAVHNGGKLATFDRRVPPTAVQGGRAALELIAP